MPGIPETPEAGDHFGLVLAVGRLNGDGFDDLAVGVPNQVYKGQTDWGTVDLFPGSRAGLLAGRLDVRLVVPGAHGVPKSDDGHPQAGAGLAIGDMNGDGIDELVVGMSQVSCDDGAKCGTVIRTYFELPQRSIDGPYSGRVGGPASGRLRERLGSAKRPEPSEAS